MTRPDSSHSDAATPELLARSREGDAGAFAELYRRYHRLALHAAARATTSVEPADVAAEAFTRIWTSLTTGRGPRSEFAAYLVATARNLAVTIAARRGREKPLPLDSGERVREAASSGEPGSDIATSIAENELVTQALMSLPERWRWALWMVEVEGYSTAELAAQTGMSHNSASALLLRARRGLRVAWLQAHVDRHPGGRRCWWTMEHLGARVAGTLSLARKVAADRHLSSCRACRAEADRLEAFHRSVCDGPETSRRSARGDSRR